MVWIKIETGNETTYPEIGKKVFWHRASLKNREKPYKVYAAMYVDKYSFNKYIVDGTNIDNDDYWIDIPDPIVKI